MNIAKIAGGGSSGGFGIIHKQKNLKFFAIIVIFSACARVTRFLKDYSYPYRVLGRKSDHSGTRASF